MAVTLKVKNPEALAEAFLLEPGARTTISLGLAVTGKVAEYALIWEWGRVSCQPGPKTQWGTNPDGQTAVMTKTAPNGFIRVNNQQYRRFMKEEMKAIPWKNIKRFSQVEPEIEKALDRAGRRCADLIAYTAPYDTYALQNAIRQYQIKPGEEVDRLSFRVRV